MLLNLSIGYKGKSLYSNTTIQLPDHGIVSFIGENGSGKSTLYKTILGVIKPLRGEVPKELIQQTAIVSDYVQIPPEVRVQDLLDVLGPDRVAFSKKNYPELYDYVKNLYSQFVKKLSSGQRRIVEIFTALSTGKKTIILDEASNALDFNNKSLLLNEIKELSKTNILFLNTSHDLDDIVFLKGDIYGLFKEQKKILPYRDKEITHEKLKDFLGQHIASRRLGTSNL